MIRNSLAGRRRIWSAIGLAALMVTGARPESEPATAGDLIDRAVEQFRSGRYAAARESYEKATENDPGSITAWIGLGWSLWRLGERDRAFQVWGDVSRVKPENVEVRFALAQAHEFRGESEEALREYGKILEKQPDRAAARMGRARVYHRLSRLPAAEAELRGVLEREPHLFEAKFLLAQILKTAGRRDEAVRLFDQLAKQPAEPGHLRELADVMLELGRPGEAIRLYERNLRHNPGNRGTILGLARAHAEGHEYARSIDYLEGLLRSRPDDAKVREELARFAGYAGDFERAEKHLRALVRDHSDETKWQMSLARLLQHKGEIEEPAAIARRILDREANHVEALELLLENARFNGRMDESVQWLERLATADPTASRLNSLGDLYIRLGDSLEEAGNEDSAAIAYQRSADAFRRAIPLNPHSADAHLGVATALRLKGEFDASIPIARQILARYPALDRARRELYESYAAKEDYAAAEEFLRSTIETFPGNLRLEHELARVRFKRGERGEAIAYVERLLREPIRQSVPVLLYHGVSESATREDTMPVTGFRDQMHALRNAGYRSISIQELLAFLDDGAPLPPKPILITFDDARADSFRYADPVLQEVGFRATMFAPVGEVGEHGPFTAVWRTIREAHESGRWDLQCHSFLGHRPIAIDSQGTQGAFLANRMWLERENRLETRAEFVRRLDDDYRRCGAGLRENIPSLRLVGYAYPFGEIGQKGFSNEPEAVAINQELAMKHYRVAFVQDPGAAVTRRSGRAVLPRFEVPWTFRGEELLRHLRSVDPWSSTMLLLADLHAWDGRFADAEAIFDGVARSENVDRADLLTRRGRVQMWQGNLMRARNELQEAGAIRPEDRLVRDSIRQLEQRLSPRTRAEGLFYGDNRQRSNVSIGPSGLVHLTDRLSLSGSYRFKRFTHDEFDPTVTSENREGASPDSSDVGSRVDLGTEGNEVEVELAWNRDWRTGISVSAGVSGFDDRSSERIRARPDPFPLASAVVNAGLGDFVDVSVRGTRSYVGAAGAILSGLGSSGAEGQLSVRPSRGVELDTRYAFFRYDDGNLRSTGMVSFFGSVWERPRAKLGYRFTYDDAREPNPFFYTPDRFVGNDGVLGIELEPFEDLSLRAETAVGLGQERGAAPEMQASVSGRARLSLGDRFQLYAGGGRSQAARFRSFQVSGGLVATF